MADPVGVSGCLIWLDASDSATLYDAISGGGLVAADGAVARWEDKSGNARHVLQSTAANRPLRKTSIQFLKDCLLFDGTNDNMLSASNFPETGNAEFSTFVVYKKLTSTKGSVFGWGSTSVSLNAFGIYDSGGSFQAYGYAGINNFNIQTIPVTDFFLQSYLKSAGAINATSTARRNKADTSASGHSTSTPNISSNPFGVGGWGSYTADSMLHGYIAEVLVYDSKLSDANRDLVEGYLYNRWILPPASRRRRDVSRGGVL